MAPISFSTVITVLAKFVEQIIEKIVSYLQIVNLLFTSHSENFNKFEYFY